MANGLLNQAAGEPPRPGQGGQVGPMGPGPGAPGPGAPAPGPSQGAPGPVAPGPGPQSGPPQGPQGGPPGQPQQGKQGDFKQATKLASTILYDKAVFDQLMNSWEKNPVEALSGTIVLILRKVEEQLGKLTMGQLFGLAIMMAGDVADAVQQASEEEVDPEVVTEALSAAVQQFLQQHPNRFSKEELEQGVLQLQQDMERVQ